MSSVFLSDVTLVLRAAPVVKHKTRLSLQTPEHKQNKRPENKRATVKTAGHRIQVGVKGQSYRGPVQNQCGVQKNNVGGNGDGKQQEENPERNQQTQEERHPPPQRSLAAGAHRASRVTGCHGNTTRSCLDKLVFFK